MNLEIVLGQSIQELILNSNLIELENHTFQVYPRT